MMSRQSITISVGYNTRLLGLFNNGPGVIVTPCSILFLIYANFYFKSLRLPGEGGKRQDPICDICVLNAHEDERPPEGFTLLCRTVNDNPADLNHGSFKVSF